MLNIKRAGKSADAVRVSVVVPAYNDEPYIGRAAASCLAQTHENMEIICVDDGSTDGTRDVLNVLATDRRVKVVGLPQNAGTHNARRAGLERATGSLVMFLDGDDELAVRTCARAAAEFVREPFGILHFASRVKADGRASDERVRMLTDWMCPVKGQLRGRDILEASFVRHEYSFSVACKAYPTSLVRRAFQQIGDIWADSGEDALEYFAIAANAETYRGLPQCRYYIYHLGDGLSEREGMTAAEFDRVLRLHSAAEGIRSFVKANNKANVKANTIANNDATTLLAISQAHWTDQLQVTLRTCLNDVRPTDRAACLRRVLQTWPEEAVKQEVCAMGSQAVAQLLDAADGDLTFTDEQLLACGRADGELVVRDEYETSASYRLGRTLTAPARLLRR